MGKLMCYVGLHPTNAAAESKTPSRGGIAIFEADTESGALTYVGAVPDPVKAGALFYAKESGILYAVNEAKSPGRSEIEKGAKVYAFRVDHETGMLTEINHVTAMGTNTIDVTALPSRHILYTATHGAGEHIEKISQNANGEWEMVFDYDDAAVAQYTIEPDGSVGRVVDVALHRDHGLDPNRSPQKGGHSQATGHAHCVVVDPTGKFLLVGDKGSDRIYVYRVGDKLSVAFIYQFNAYSGARHIAFDPVISGRMYITLEFSSELASFDFDTETGALTELDRISTVDPAFSGRNEPSTLRCSRNGAFIYVVNRGADEIVTVTADRSGKLTRVKAFPIDKCPDPGLGTRQIELSPDNRFLYVAERPSYLVRTLAVNADGSLSDVSASEICNPVFICFAEL